MKTEEKIEIDGKELTLTNLDKVFWPKERFTKGELIDYYRSVAKYILPYLKDRPESMNRYPDGIQGESFFQKNLEYYPDWAELKKIRSDSEERDINYLLCQNEATLVYMINLGCIELNPWNSKVENLDKPDYMIIDLDPGDIKFDKVVEAALVIHEILDKCGADNYCKTSGATGLHIYVPFGGKYTYDQAKNFAEIIATYVNSKLPDTTSIVRSPEKRRKQIYLDYLQNRKGQTLAAPYSVRPRPGIPVSTPLKWEEIKLGLDPKEFTAKNILKRLEEVGDIWKPVLGKGINLDECLKKLEKVMV